MIYLMQNCDLPTPSKLYFGSNDLIISSMNRVFAMMVQEKGQGDEEERGKEKLELLKAVRLSQTRAREAEKRAESLGKDKEWISNALSAESLQLFAYRQWSKLLEARILKLEEELAKAAAGRDCVKPCLQCREEERNRDGIPWTTLSLASFCIGIAIGFRYWF
ncbi:hypothetical protein LINPERPRIM_LOCUS10966 [Linum perenne]